MIQKLMNRWREWFGSDDPKIPDLHEAVRKEKLCADVDRKLVQSGYMTDLYRDFPKDMAIRKTLQQQQTLLHVGGIITVEWLDDTKLYMSIEVLLLEQPNMWVRAAILQDATRLSIQIWNAPNISDLMFVAFGVFFDSISATHKTFMGVGLAATADPENKPPKSTVLKLVSNRGHADEPNPE